VAALWFDSRDACTVWAWK